MKQIWPRGIFMRLNQWLDEHIRQYGCMYTGTELIQRLTGSRLDARPFLRYLEKKYVLQRNNEQS